jgi:hypothetical protein
MIGSIKVLYGETQLSDHFLGRVTRINDMYVYYIRNDTLIEEGHNKCAFYEMGEEKLGVNVNDYFYMIQTWTPGDYGCASYVTILKGPLAKTPDLPIHINNYQI